jgi:hypothetical protein
LQELATEELSYELDVAQEASLELEDVFLILALQELNGLLGEELVETGTAVRQQGLAEERASNVLFCRNKASQAQLQSDNFLAEFSIENTILLFVLSLTEDGLNDDLEVFLAQILVGKCRVQFFIVTCLIGCLEITESVAAELLKLLIEIIGKDNVDDETDLLKNIFIPLCLFDSLLAFFDQLLAEEVGLLTLKLVILGQRLSIAAVVGLADALLEAILALRILVVVLVVATAASSVAALIPVMSRLLSSTLGEGRFLELDQVGLAAQLSGPERLLSWFRICDAGDALYILKSLHPFLACSGLESGDQFLNFLDIFVGSLNACLFDSFNDWVLHHLRSRGRRSYLCWSWCRGRSLSRSWSWSWSWSGSLSWLLKWHERFGLNVETLGKRWLSGEWL